MYSQIQADKMKFLQFLDGYRLIHYKRNWDIQKETNTFCLNGGWKKNNTELKTGSSGSLCEWSASQVLCSTELLNGNSSNIVKQMLSYGKGDGHSRTQWLKQDVRAKKTRRCL